MFVKNFKTNRIVFLIVLTLSLIKIIKSEIDDDYDFYKDFYKVDTTPPIYWKPPIYTSTIEPTLPSTSTTIKLNLSSTTASIEPTLLSTSTTIELTSPSTTPSIEPILFSTSTFMEATSNTKPVTSTIERLLNEPSTKLQNINIDNGRTDQRDVKTSTVKLITKLKKRVSTKISTTEKFTTSSPKRRTKTSDKARINGEYYAQINAFVELVCGYYDQNHKVKWEKVGEVS